MVRLSRQNILVSSKETNGRTGKTETHQLRRAAKHVRNVKRRLFRLGKANAPTDKKHAKLWWANHVKISKVGVQFLVAQVRIIFRRKGKQRTTVSRQVSLGGESWPPTGVTCPTALCVCQCQTKDQRSEQQRFLVSLFFSAQRGARAQDVTRCHWQKGS